MTAVPPELAPDQLTALLRRAGVLAHGEVIDVVVETARDTLISHIVRLRVTYAGDAGRTPPPLLRGGRRVRALAPAARGSDRLARAVG